MKNDTAPEARSAFRTAQSNALTYWLNRGSPVIPARPVSSLTWVITCPYCGGMHRHGAMNGHRIPPCGQDWPEPGTGYVIEVAA